MKENKFTVGVEKLVRPVEVGNIHFLQSFTGSLPLKMQNKLVKSSAKKVPLMGFVVDPYSYFICYEISDLEQAESLLPKHFKMTKTKVFETDEPKYYGIFGIFNAHTAGFFGLRTEFYLIAEDERTGLMSWVIIEYDTNTISYDPKKGFSKPNSSDGVFTIDYDGIVHVNMSRDDGTHKLVFQSDITKGVMEPLDERLWIEGNLSIGYGKEMADEEANAFSLKFDPKEFEQALRIEKNDFHLEVNTWFPGLFKEEPDTLLCFPYAQHYMSDSPGAFSRIQSKKDLVEAIKKVDFKTITAMSTEPLKKLIFGGLALSGIINILLITLLLI